MNTLSELDITKNWGGDRTPVVSICCITYKQEKYIEQALNSFLLQKTNFPFEILIGEDCGGDNTLTLIGKYIEKYPSIIKLYSSTTNVGANANLLKLFNLAQGDYIAICEGDDYWCDSFKLQKQIDFIERRADISFCVHSAYSLKGEQKQIAYDRGDNEFNVYDVISTPYGGWAPTASYLFRRQVVDILPEWFVNAPVGDYYIEIYSLKLGRGAFFKEPMSVYRCMAENSWSKGIVDSFELFCDVRNKIIKFDELTKLDFPEYSEIISERIFRTKFIIARQALLSGKYDIFTQYLDEMVVLPLPDDINKKMKVYLFFRNTPKILSLIIKTKSFFVTN